jgi:hypothetical protein
VHSLLKRSAVLGLQAGVAFFGLLRRPEVPAKRDQGSARTLRTESHGAWQARPCTYQWFWSCRRFRAAAVAMATRHGRTAVAPRLPGFRDWFAHALGHAARQQPAAFRIYCHAVVVGLAAVDPCPYPAHRAPVVRSRSSHHGRPRRHCSTQRLSRTSQLAAESSWGAMRPSHLSHGRQRHESHTRLPWVPQPYEWLRPTQKEGRAA